MSPAYPSLYQVNTRVLLTALSRTLGRPATLDDIPDAELDRIAGLGFDYVWLLSVWRTGSAGQRVSSAHAGWRHEFEDTLPDLCAEDIAGSGFAITGYTAHPAVGGTAALARTRRRLQARGLKLMLDFVPNHTALDHPWVEDHPDYYVGAGELEQTRAPQNYTWVKRMRGDVLLAHGRDPYFDGWPDTLQLDYANPATQEAMIGELLVIAEQCDAVRCDMAMLVLPKIFERTWVYWDPESTMMQEGFDYAYDKRLYDRLREGHARLVREHLWAGLDYQNRLARFMENHDEPRAAPTFASGMHEAAAQAYLAAPGSRSARARRRGPAAVLRQPPDGAETSKRPGWRVVSGHVRPHLGRQLDLRLLPRLVLARAGRPASPRGRQLCRQPEPVLRPSAVRGPRGPLGTAQGPDGSRHLRSRRSRRPRARPLSRPSAVGLPRLRADGAVTRRR